MKDKLWIQVKNLTGIDDSSGLELIFNTMTDQAPIIGKILTTYKIHRLGNRLKANESKIDVINEKVDSVEDSKFIDLLKNFLFPTILQELLEEDEDNKIGCFLDGFGQVIDNYVNDKSKILIYYDVLKEVRFIELEYLITFSSEYKRYRSKCFFESGNRQDSVFEGAEFREMKYAVENKLERLGLINTGRLISYEEVMKRMDEGLWRAKRHLASPRRDEVKLTNFGYQFLKFFCLLDKYKLQE